MAAIDARLTREIREPGAAGAILFAWLDEWFKKNWVVIEYEIPLDNTRLWHNVMDAEQNYGILGQYAGEARTTPVLGGDPRALAHGWPFGAAASDDPATRAAPASSWSDESFFYLAVECRQEHFPGESLGIQLAIDTYLPRVGQHRLPGSQVRSEIGFEFLIDLPGPSGGRMLVTPDYNRHDSRLDPGRGDDVGRFSRGRDHSRSGGRAIRFPVRHHQPGPLRAGRNVLPGSGIRPGQLLHGTEAASSLADWYLDEQAGCSSFGFPGTCST